MFVVVVAMYKLIEYKMLLSKVLLLLALNFHLLNRSEMKGN